MLDLLEKFHTQQYKEMCFRVDNTREKCRNLVFPDEELMSSQDSNMKMDREEGGGAFMSGCSSTGVGE